MSGRSVWTARRRAQGLGIVAVDGAGLKARVGKLDLDGVEGIGRIGRNTWNRQDIEGRRIVDTCSDLPADIAAGIKHFAAAVQGQNLKRQVAARNLLERGDVIEECRIVVAEG
jgi:hypothetical protein